MKKAFFLLASILVLTLFAACGADNTPTPTRTPARTATATATVPTASPSPTATPTGSPTTGSTVAVELKEFSIAPNPTSAASGQVTFNATNSGILPHQFLVIKTDTAHDALPVSGGIVDETAVGQKMGEIEESQLLSKGRASVSVQLTAGKYVLICNVAGHYEGGMHAGFEVK